MNYITNNFENKLGICESNFCFLQEVSNVLEENCQQVVSNLPRSFLQSITKHLLIIVCILRITLNLINRFFIVIIIIIIIIIIVIIIYGLHDYLLFYIILIIVFLNALPKVIFLKKDLFDF